MDRTEKIKNTWSNYFHISNSEGMKCGNMICYKCKEKIEGDYLIQERTNHLLRGNENDECYIFHRKCSEENVKWKEFDEENIKREKAMEVRSAQIKEVNDMISKYGLESVFCNDDNDY